MEPATITPQFEDTSACVLALAGNDGTRYHRLQEDRMHSLSVRKIDPEVYRRLRMRAAKHGVSMEEEVRRILAYTVNAPERLGDLALHCFENDGIELQLPPREVHEPVARSSGDRMAQPTGCQQPVYFDDYDRRDRIRSVGFTGRQAPPKPRGTIRAIRTRGIRSTYSRVRRTIGADLSTDRRSPQSAGAAAVRAGRTDRLDRPRESDGGCDGQRERLRGVWD